MLAQAAGGTAAAPSAATAALCAAACARSPTSRRCCCSWASSGAAAYLPERWPCLVFGVRPLKAHQLHCHRLQLKWLDAHNTSHVFRQPAVSNNACMRHYSARMLQGGRRVVQCRVHLPGRLCLACQLPLLCAAGPAGALSVFRVPVCFTWYVHRNKLNCSPRASTSTPPCSWTSWCVCTLGHGSECL